MRLLLTLISKVPFGALYFVSTAFYLLNRYVIRYRYDVVRGDVANLDLPGGGVSDLGPVVCLDDDSRDVRSQDPAAPLPGQAFFYLFVGLYVVLFAGKRLNEGIGFLRNFSIPEPVSGGLLFTLLFMLWYVRYAYRWMMRADSQWGKGSGWVLKERTVILPELKE